MRPFFIFTLWFILLSIPLSYMMGSHSLSLIPSKNEKLKKLIDPFKNNSKWTLIHFLGGDCYCSNNIYKSLINRKPYIDSSEQVFVIGRNEVWVSELKKRGYLVSTGDMNYFSKFYSINAVPQLSIFDGRNNLIYSGGYSSRRGPSSLVEDLQILKDLKSKHQIKERPIFGCLNGTINRKNADPFSLKY